MKTFILLIPLFLAGCASQDYVKYSETVVAVQTAKANAEAEKYKAMAAIAKSGDTTAKVAAMMAMQNNQQQLQVQIAAPKTSWDIAREMLGIFVPAIVQGYGIHANQNIAVTQSNNSKEVAVSTNQAFVGIASQIQAPAANITTTLSGTGVLGSGSYTTDQHNITGSYNPIDNSNQGNPIDNSNYNNPVAY